MSDLDDLASAARGGAPSPSSHRPVAPGKPSPPGATRKRPARQTETAPPVPQENEGPARPPGVSPRFWVGLAVGIVVVLGLAFWVINRNAGPSPTQLATAPQRPLPATAPATPRPAGGSDAGTPAALSSGEAGGATTTTTPTAATPPVDSPTRPPSTPPATPARAGLVDVEEPADAIEVYHLKRDADNVSFKIRNRSRRGVYVRALEFFAESDDRVALDSIRFWLPPGGVVTDTRDIAEMVRRLGDEEGVTAAVQDAEFSDSLPRELQELMNESDAAEADQDDAADQSAEEGSV